MDAALLLQEWKGAEWVYSVTVSPDGSRIGVACGIDVVIIDADTGRMALHPLQGHTDQVMSVAFSPDGHTIASTSMDDSIRFWDTNTGETALDPVTGHTDWVSSVAYMPDCSLFISGSSDCTIGLWDPRTGQPVGKRISTPSRVYAIAVSPDSMRIVGAFMDTIQMFDSATRTLLFEYPGHTGFIYSLAFSPDGHRLASASGDRTVRFWNVSTGAAIGYPIEAHTDRIRSIAFSPDSRYIASASDDKTIQIWDADTRTTQGDPLSGHVDVVWSIAFTPDGSHLVSGSFDRSIKIWDVRRFCRVTDSVKRTQSMGSIEPETEITTAMSSREIVSCLLARGCTDMSRELNWLTCSDHPISSGGFGDIYRCRLINNGEVAIKTVRIYVGIDEQDHKALKRAAREIYTWSKCRHPNVQPLLGLVVFRSQIGMVASWETNGNLPEYLKRHPEADRCAMIADGLAYLHASKVVHGDLKGVNVLISRSGIARLADFGNAVLYEYSLRFSRTSTKDILTAPELLEGEKCSQQSDMYALGMTILETVTGQVPWAGKTDLGVQFAVAIKKTVPERPVEQIPTESMHGDALWSLLQWCWTFEPCKRPGADIMTKLLRGITQDGLKVISS